MLFSKTLSQERIAKGAWEGDVHDAARVHVSDLGVPKPEYDPNYDPSLTQGDEVKP